MSTFNNLELQQFVFKRIKGQKNQNLCNKLKGLSKNDKNQFEEVINRANLKYKNLEGLAASKFSPQIQNLVLNVPSELYYLDDLRFISTKYFNNIKSVKLRFVDPNQDRYRIQSEKLITITEDTSIQGLTIKVNSFVKRIAIRGKHNVKIQNSKFNGLGLDMHENTSVEISNVKFLNSPHRPFVSFYCPSLVMQDIHIKNCTYSACIINNQKVIISNINIQQCTEGYGIELHRVSDFQISNATIYKSAKGIYFNNSQGRMKSVFVSECEGHGVLLIHSQVYYNQFICINNGKNDVEVGDFINDEEASEFIQQD